MALNLETKYGARANAADVDYPYGSIKDKVGGVADTGTPVEADIMNDFVGLGQKLLSTAAIIPSNAPDNVTSSQYYNAMTTIFPTKTELAAAAGSGLVGHTQTPFVANLSFYLNLNTDVYPEMFGVVAGSSAAGAANRTGFIAMLDHVKANGGTIRLPPKTYHILGDVDLSFASGQTQIIRIVGAGSKGDTNTSSVLHFSSYVAGQTRGLYWANNDANCHMEGFTILGAGKTVLNDASAAVDGLNDKTSSFSNGLTMIDIAFRDWSGDGANINYWFQQRWIGCYARNCAGWGIVIDGDQSPLFDMTGGAFFRLCDTGALWIKKGNAVVRGWNGEDLPIGLKIGDGSAKRVRLDISGANFERMNAGSTAIDVGEFSQINSMLGCGSQGPETTGDTALYGIRFRRLNGYNSIQDYRPIWFVTSNGNGIDVPIQIDAVEPDAVLELPQSRDDLITMGYGTTLLVQGAGRLAARKVRGNTFGDEPAILDAGIKQNGKEFIKSISHVQSVDGSTLDLFTDDGGTVSMYYLDATAGNITVNLPSEANALIDDIAIKFKRVDSSAFTVTLSTVSTQPIDGVDNYSIPALGFVEIHKPTDIYGWFKIGQI